VLVPQFGLSSDDPVYPKNRVPMRFLSINGVRYRELEWHEQSQSPSQVLCLYILKYTTDFEKE